VAYPHQRHPLGCPLPREESGRHRVDSLESRNGFQHSSTTMTHTRRQIRRSITRRRNEFGTAELTVRRSNRKIASPPSPDHASLSACSFGRGGLDLWVRR
jgi:hypothetical protein